MTDSHRAVTRVVRRSVMWAIGIGLVVGFFLLAKFFGLWQAAVCYGVGAVLAGFLTADAPGRE